MEIIGYGTLLACGFYLAPLILTATVMTAGAIIGGIANIFRGDR